MKKIKSTNTSIEVKLRKALWNRGYRYRKNYKELPGTPDIVIIKYKIAITKVDNAVLDLQKQINPIGDITTLPFSSERKIYKDSVWSIIDDYLNL